MIDPTTIPDPGLPLADGYYLQHARASLHALGIRTPEAFQERYGIDIHDLTAFGLLYVVAPDQAAHELRLNELYRSGLPGHRRASAETHCDEDTAA